MAPELFFNFSTPCILLYNIQGVYNINLKTVSLGKCCFLWCEATCTLNCSFDALSITNSLHLIFTMAQQPPPPQWARASSLSRIHVHTQWRTTVGRTPLDEWSARRRDHYLTKHSTHNWQASMPSAGFEPTIPASEWPQTYALDRIRDVKPTKRTVMFIRYLHYSITLNIPACFHPQGNIIRGLNRTNMA